MQSMLILPRKCSSFATNQNALIMKKRKKKDRTKFVKFLILNYLRTRDKKITKKMIILRVIDRLLAIRSEASTNANNVRGTSNGIKFQKLMRTYILFATAVMFIPAMARFLLFSIKKKIRGSEKEVLSYLNALKKIPIMTPSSITQRKV
jgi:hypothetical protein